MLDAASTMEKLLEKLHPWHE